MMIKDLHVKLIETCLDIANTVVFNVGGDRGKDNTPELDRFCNDLEVEFYYGVGGL